MPDDYLDRLDAAFAALKSSPRPAGGPLAPLSDEDEAQQPRLPTPITARTPLPATAPVDPVEVVAGAVPLIPAALVDEITRLVIARLADQEVRRVVLDTAERLVREEIDRIKRARA